ncbi:polysaccharide deacetylase family protein [Belliella aquatica]|uniref:NodB homology domain-containing protein n=1 Tax=Belliella aquatica TaxID=1323734 RepID=A0ABQ1M0N4_9BACT|nr:polysaccharide deacetylase family protein [Belliella aquatica]MCH7407325.1 polysaccharide deacetylase family protein [Belliella aquatica]GGC31753.1 hypothetical protein GCM10010993_08390 [Belliella aquatica]
MHQPIFTISLDFELHWGRFDKYDIKQYHNYYKNTVELVIPHLLELFHKYQIQATWATVGILMAENEEEWGTFIPECKPLYANQKLSPYAWLGQQEHPAPVALFAPQLVKQILSLPTQELASHTFSHFYTCESEQNNIAFEQDLIAAKNIAKQKFNTNLESLVFPRNQYNTQALNTAESLGFTSYRSNPEDWFWKNTEHETLIKKLFRTGDTLVSLGNKTSYKIPKKAENQILALPASRLLRPFRKIESLQQIRVAKITNEMTHAAEQQEVYHLWWHPHNFGHFPKENLLFLEKILKHYTQLSQSHNMRSLSMKNTTQLV